jgi:hypothetical protein
MNKLIATVGAAALVTGCATLGTGPGEPLSRGATPAGAAKAALLGYHGPLYRNGSSSEGPN